MFQVGNFGFTIIESLISITILALIGTIIASLLSQTYKSNAKTQLLGTVKQNGQTALSNIEQSIRQADSILCVGSAASSTYSQLASSTTATFYSGDTIMLINRIGPNAGKYTRYQFVSGVGSGSSKSNGSLTTDTVLVNDPSTDYTQCAQKITAGQTIIDTNAMTGLSIFPNSSQAGYFVVNRKSGAKDTVTVAFSLGPNVNNNFLPENSLGDNNLLPFQTTIVLR